MARALWKGDISFGLVSVPVGLYTSVSEAKIHFHRVTPDGSCRLRQKLYCPETGKEYDFKEAAKGFEIAPDEYVIVDDDELKELKPEDESHTINILHFVKLEEIDPIYYRRTYYLAPEKRGHKPYQLLAQTMSDKNAVGIAKFIMRNNEYLAALRVLPSGYLALESMYYDEDIVSTEDLKEIQEKEITKQELKLAAELIDSLITEFKAQEYENEYRTELQEFLEEKEKDGTVRPSQKKSKSSGKVVDLMDALKKSVKDQKSQSKKKTKAA